MDNFLIIGLLSVVLVQVSSSSYSDYYNEQSSSPDQSKCFCNDTLIFSKLPHFMKALSEDANFEWVYQGREGERGDQGPIGPQGIPGRNGRDGEKGEAGLPGESIVERGEKGEKGDQGRPGRTGLKGEAGTPIFHVLKHGSYFEVKGEKGDAGKRGRRGQPGIRGQDGYPGLTVVGAKGEKGEPGLVPDLEYFKGARGPPGPRGRPGPCCGDSKTQGKDFAGPFLIPMPGSPGLNVQGEKGAKGEVGPPGKTPELSAIMVPGASVFKTEMDMRLVRSQPGTICYVEEEERVYIRVKNGWKEIQLGPLRLDRMDPDRSQTYPIGVSQQFEPSHKHVITNEVEVKQHFPEKIRNERYLKKYRHGQRSV